MPDPMVSVWFPARGIRPTGTLSLSLAYTMQPLLFPPSVLVNDPSTAVLCQCVTSQLHT